MLITKGFKSIKTNLALTLSNRGFTLIEVVIYIAILSVVSGVVVTFIVQTLTINESGRRTRESLDNARRSLETISQEIKFSKNIYTPTSCFSGDVRCPTFGQLTIETTRTPEDVAADEVAAACTASCTGYADFYIDNGGLYFKKEGKVPQLLTSEKVKVTKLAFTDLYGVVATNRPAIRVQITVEYNQATSGPKNAISLETTAAPRSY